MPGMRATSKFAYPFAKSIVDLAGCIALIILGVVIYFSGNRGDLRALIFVICVGAILGGTAFMCFLRLGQRVVVTERYIILESFGREIRRLSREEGIEVKRLLIMIGGTGLRHRLSDGRASFVVDSNISEWETLLGMIRDGAPPGSEDSSR